MEEQSDKLNKQLTRQKELADEAEAKLAEIKYNQKEHTAELDREIATLSENMDEVRVRKIYSFSNYFLYVVVF